MYLEKFRDLILAKLSGSVSPLLTMCVKGWLRTRLLDILAVSACFHNKKTVTKPALSSTSLAFLALESHREPAMQIGLVKGLEKTFSLTC